MYGAHATEDRIYWLAQVRPPYAVGDLLWIREAVVRVADMVAYVAVDRFAPDIYAEVDGCAKLWSWKREKLPAMFMPRWACRYYARVVSVRPERLLDITDEDAAAEGTLVDIKIRDELGQMDSTETSREHYAQWWDSMHKKPGTRSEDNPWVWGYGLEDADASTE